MSDDRVAVCRNLLGELAAIQFSLGRETTYRIGGETALFIEINDHPSLERVAAAAVTSGIEVLVLGNGSNLLIADRGFDGLAIRLGGQFAELQIDSESGSITAGAACSYPVLARQSVASGLSGLEWAVGIPGTVGGAVTMNAGGHGSMTEMNLVDATVLDFSTGTQSRLRTSELGCSYRHSNIESHQLVVGATFQAVRSIDRSASQAELDEIVRWRRNHQPGGRNCGSVFTNPPQDSAGRLIESVGLKGHRLGSAQVSTKHANFIQADADGRADDVRELIDEIALRVFEMTGVALETELRMVGFDQ